MLCKAESRTVDALLNSRSPPLRSDTSWKRHFAGPALCAPTSSLPMTSSPDLGDLEKEFQKGVLGGARLVFPGTFLFAS